MGGPNWVDFSPGGRMFECDLISVYGRIWFACCAGGRNWLGFWKRGESHLFLVWACKLTCFSCWWFKLTWFQCGESNLTWFQCKAISYATALRTENEHFRVAKSINLMDPNLVIVWTFFFQFSFSGRPPTGNGPYFRLTSAIETGAWIWVSTHRGRQRALRYAENNSRIKAAFICQPSNKTCAPCCALLPSPARLRHHHEPLWLCCYDCVHYESSFDVEQP